MQLTLSCSTAGPVAPHRGEGGVVSGPASTAMTWSETTSARTKPHLVGQRDEGPTGIHKPKRHKDQLGTAPFIGCSGWQEQSYTEIPFPLEV